jgi:hypothetical protein
MQYKVKYLRKKGLTCRWGRLSNGAPIIFGQRKDGDLNWYAIDDRMWRRAEEVGIMQAFDEATALGTFFSVRA